MARSNKLTVKKIESLVKNGWLNKKGEVTRRGTHSDGDGLFLQFAKGGQCSWVYCYYPTGGKPRFHGLGGYPSVTLEAARLKRDEDKKLFTAGIDPILAGKQKRIQVSNALTVMQASEGWIAVHEKEWKTKRYASQIRARLKKYVEPHIGHLPIADIQLADIESVLVPIWTDMRQTANRIRKHLEDIIDWAINKGVRTNESNPAEKKRLKSSVSFAKRDVDHYPSLPYTDAPGFLTELRKQEGVKARALEFTMLNANRIGDIVGGGKHHSVPMLWSHVDLPGQCWTVPDTKTGKAHKVPLSEPAMRLLGEMRHLKDPTTDFVFPGSKRGTVISDATLRYLLRDMGYSGIATTHGFRATFATWANEVSDYDEKIIDSCLAHAQEEQDEAYHRGRFFDKRRRLMAAWADYLEGEAVSLGGDVIALRA